LAGSLIYEVQQASDTTYRLFDYDRLDGGMKRELHLAEALDAVNAPSRPVASAPVITGREDAVEASFVSNEWFSVSRWEVTGEASIPIDAPFLLVGALAGAGTVNGASVAAGDHFLVPAGVPRLAVTGQLTLMVTRP
jgi:mannose-6-phosphate isomerase